MTLCFPGDCTLMERGHVTGLMLRVMVGLTETPKAPVMKLSWGPMTFYLVLQ